MDVVSVITAVYALAKGIHTWLDEREEKNETIKQLSATVSQIHTILLPLQSMSEPTHIEQQTLDTIKGVGDVLKRTQEHLFVWEYKRSHRFVAFISPSTAIKQLKDDETHLNQQLVLLITCITVIGYIEHRRNRESKGPETVLKKEASEHPVSSTTSGDGEVKVFWRDYIGEKIPFISGNDFISRLKIWLGEDLDPAARERLLLRLDEYGIGGVTPSNLEKFIGLNSMRYVIKLYSQDRDAPEPTKIASASPLKYQNIRLPLFVFIDDYPENISYEVSIAEDLELNVMQFTSTAVAKAWIDSNDYFLRQHGSLVRFISDNHRDEPTSGPYLNLTAGENILRYLRGRQHNMPVLIYCGASITETGYVTNYSNAGSTCSAPLCAEYISAFAGKIHDTGEWMGFDVGFSGSDT